MSRLFFLPQAVRIDSTGTPYAGALANFYLTTTTTRTDTYTDNARAVAHANPVVADSAGQFAAIYLDPSITYRCIITESDTTQIDDVDPIHVPIAGGDIVITDSGGYYAGSDVETILADIGANYMTQAGDETITGDKTFSSAFIQMADNFLLRPNIGDYAIRHSDYTQTTGTVTISAGNGNSAAFTLTENATIVLQAPSPTGSMCQMSIEITQDGAGGAYTVTWPAGVVWPGGTAPTMTTGNGAVDVVTLYTRDEGTIWYGNFSQAYS